MDVDHCRKLNILDKHHIIINVYMNGMLPKSNPLKLLYCCKICINENEL